MKKALVAVMIVSLVAISASADQKIGRPEFVPGPIMKWSVVNTSEKDTDTPSASATDTFLRQDDPPEARTVVVTYLNGEIDGNGGAKPNVTLQVIASDGTARPGIQLRIGNPITVEGSLMTVTVGNGQS